MITLGTPLVLMAEQLGGSSFAVGLAYAGVFLVLPIQVVATVTIPRLGFKKQAAIGWSVRLLGTGVALWLAFLSPEEPKPWMIWVFIGAILWFCILRSFGSAALTPWLFAWIDDDVRGRYFATEQTLVSASGILVLLFLSGLFAILPEWRAFQISYLLALVGGGLAVFFMLKFPNEPAPGRTSLRLIGSRAWQLASRPSDFRRYLSLAVIWWVMISAVSPFMIYYLKTEAGMTTSRILLYSIFGNIATIIGALALRSRIDYYGPKPFFLFSNMMYALIGLYWLAMLTVAPWLVKFVGASFFLLGLAGSNWFAPHLKYLPQVCPDDERPLAVSLHSAMTGVAAGLAPMAWGLFVKNSDGSPGVRVDHFIIFFIVLIVVQLGLIFPYSRLREREISHPMVLPLNPRTIRILNYLINVVPPRAKQVDPAVESAPVDVPK